MTEREMLLRAADYVDEAAGRLARLACDHTGDLYNAIMAESKARRDVAEALRTAGIQP